MVTWVAPWATVMLLHYYWVRRERIDVHRCSTTPGASRIATSLWPAVVAFVVGHRSPPGPSSSASRPLLQGPAGQGARRDRPLLAGRAPWSSGVHRTTPAAHLSAGTARVADAAPRPVGSEPVHRPRRPRRPAARVRSRSPCRPADDAGRRPRRPGRFLARPAPAGQRRRRPTVVDAGGRRWSPAVRRAARAPRLLRSPPASHAGTRAARCGRASPAGPSASRC